jgi:hypothetical protein
MWNFKDANFAGFREKLSETIWDDCFDTQDPSLACENWTNLFLAIANKFISSKTVIVRPNDKTWYNNYLRRLARLKDRSHRKWVRIRTDENERNYALTEIFILTNVQG